MSAKVESVDNGLLGVGEGDDDDEDKEDFEDEVRFDGSVQAAELIILGEFDETRGWVRESAGWMKIQRPPY